MNFTILEAKQAELEALDEAITDYNVIEAPELPRAEIHRLDFVAKDHEDELMGGIQAKRVNWGILHVELLYVFAPYRGRGVASTLLEYVEKKAKEHRCHIAHLSTFDFQAKDFYLRHGYSLFGTLENAPKGHRRYYLKKELFEKEQSVSLRPMRESDIDLLVLNFSFPWSSAEATRVLWNRYYREQQENIRTVVVLEKENRLLGYGSLLRRSEYPHFVHIPEIHNVWIGEEHRRAGLGTKLIAYLEDLARKEGYKQIGIGVGLYEDYGPAQKLYFELGYVPDGHGITHKCKRVVPGESYPVDDELLLWLMKSL